MSEPRIWNQRDQALLHEAIGRELVARLAHEGRTVEELSDDERARRKYRIHLDFTTGATAGEARAKVANLHRMLDAGMVPILAQTVPFSTAGITSMSDLDIDIEQARHAAA